LKCKITINAQKASINQNKVFLRIKNKALLCPKVNHYAVRKFIMKKIKYYIVDVFATKKYEGNQLAVFVDLDNQLSDAEMQTMAREINFSETTFIKSANEHSSVVRIFTPEHEVPFAGHPSLGTSYIIAKFLLKEPTGFFILELPIGDIMINISDPKRLDKSIFEMRQTQPKFSDQFSAEEISAELGIPKNDIDPSVPLEEITTGLPYIIIPLKNLAAMENLKLDVNGFKNFLEKRNKYKTNSATGHSTSLFFFTKETYNAENQYNTRMLLIENERLSEDAATGSANGCFLAYLLKHQNTTIKATVEQGFQMNRNSYIYLDGQYTEGSYQIDVGGKVQLVSEGKWFV
jgi:trans-2,3-dihydro-3-hydroxyanthranilate isomerase